MSNTDEIKAARAARLKTAREAAGIELDDAAKAFQIGYSTYAAHENATTPYRLESAVQYAKKFKVSLDWLIVGKGKGPGETDEIQDELLTLWPELNIDERQSLLTSAVLYVKRRK